MKGTKIKRTEIVTFGGGCFWGVELVFSELPGVLKTEVGYMGGTLQNPSYKDVCTDATGHAEVVQVTYDPKRITYDKLLTTFWKIHDPTTLNQQGPDIGTQYRSVIFYHTEKQKSAAEKSRGEQQKQLSKKIVTQIIKTSTFYRAEEYHQQYLKKRGLVSCHI